MPFREMQVVIALGVGAGFASGVFGIGGGVVLVPALVYVMGYSQHLAQGTTLGLLCLPVGLAAAVSYHREGYVQWNVVALLFCGFLLGSVTGSHFAVSLPEVWLKRLFGACLISLGARMLLFR